MSERPQAKAITHPCNAQDKTSYNFTGFTNSISFLKISAAFIPSHTV
jgi:hypothetical protein